MITNKYRTRKVCTVYVSKFCDFLLTTPLCAILCYFCSLHRQPKHLLAFLMAELGTRYVLITTCKKLSNKLINMYVKAI